MSKKSQSVRIMSVLASGASVFALAYLQPALAQETAQPAASSSGGLEEVVVTARRREEKAQSVPITITAFNSDALAKQDALVMNDLAKVSTGFTICCGDTPGSSPGGGPISLFWIRDVPGGVSYFNGQAQLADNNPALFFDDASTQILKGPQGTLFGVSATAGAVVVEPKKPTNNFEGFVETTLGNYGRYTFSAVVNVPIIEDKVLVRVGASRYNDDGDIYDITQHKEVDATTYQNGRMIVTLRPTDDFQNEFLLMYNAGWITGDGGDWGEPLRVNWAIWNGVEAKVFGLANLQAQWAVQQRLGLYNLDTTPGAPYSGFGQRIWNAIDTATWDVNDNLTIKNILNYEQYQSLRASIGNVSFVSFGNICLVCALNTAANGNVPIPFENPGPEVQYGDELQFLGKLFDDKLTYVVGTFNQVEAQQSPYPNYCGNQTFGALSSCTISETNTPEAQGAVGRTDALYAQGTYDLSEFTTVDGLSATLGYRYTWDKIYSGPVVNSTLTGVVVPALSGSAIQHEHDPSYTFSLDYQLNPQTLIYVTNSKGYSKGGFNAFTLPPSLRTYGAESLNNIELGTKTDNEILGIKTRNNTAIWYGFYDNIKELRNLAIVNPISGIITTVNPTQNVAAGHIYGIEDELTVIPDPRWEFHNDITYARIHLDSYPTIDPVTLKPVNDAGEKVQYSPQLAWRISGTWHPPLDWISPGTPLGDLSITANFSWKGVQVDTVNPGVCLNCGDETPDISQLDLNATWKDFLGHPGLDASMFATNVNNNIWGESNYSLTQTLGTTIGIPAEKRRIGVTMRYSFGP